MFPSLIVETEHKSYSNFKALTIMFLLGFRAVLVVLVGATLFKKPKPSFTLGDYSRRSRRSRQQFYVVESPISATIVAVFGGSIM